MSNIKIQGNASGAGTTTLQSANTASSTTFTLPGTDGTSNQALVTDGSGNLSFATVGGTTTNALTMNNGGSGDASGTTFNGSAARTLSYNTLGAAATAASNTFTAAQTFRAANAVRSEAASTQDAVVVAGRAGGTGSYAVTLTPATLASSTTLTLPNVTDTIATIGTAQTFTAAQTFRAANAIRSEAASTQDAIILAGRAGGTSSYAITLTPATLSASRTLTLPEPGENVTLGYLNSPVNSQSAAYTLVLADSGKTILHPSTDANARTFTIPANGSVAYATGTVVTFINMTSQVVTIAITTDTMYLAGTGSTGSRSLAQYGIATAVKIDSTTWVISGNGLT